MSDQAYITLSWVVLGLAVSIALPALFFDWARQLVLKRRRCPKCWYNMTGAPGLTCSECGRTVKRERHLRRARRRWRFVVLAFLMLIGSHLLHCGPAIKERGWAVAIPTSVLVFIAPYSRWTEMSPWPDDRPTLGVPDDWLMWELLVRVHYYQSVAPWQRAVYIKRLFRGNPNAIHDLVCARQRWPVGLPVDVIVRQPWYAGGEMQDDVVVRVRIRAEDDDKEARVFMTWDCMLSHDESRLHLGMPSAGAEQFEIEVEILIGAVINDDSLVHESRVDLSNAKRVWSGSLPSVHLCDHADDILQPHESVEADQAIVRSLRPYLFRSSDNRVWLVVRLDKDHIATEQVERDLNWALGTEVEVRRDGRLVGQGTMVYPMPYPSSAPGLYLGPFHASFELDWDSKVASAMEAGKWQVTFRSDPNIAIYDLTRDTHWAGEVVMPIRWGSDGSWGLIEGRIRREE